MFTDSVYLVTMSDGRINWRRGFVRIFALLVLGAMALIIFEGADAVDTAAALLSVLLIAYGINWLFRGFRSD